MKKKQRISDLFYDNRFLLVFSLVTAVVFWLIVVVVFGPETENTVKNVPVQIDYAEIQEKLGLEPFGETKFTVDVKISGKKYIVESDDIADDIVVTAKTSYVNSVGTYRLTLEESTVEVRPDFEIVDLSVDEIEVYFDYPREKEFVIEPDIEFKGGTVAEGYHIGEYIFPEANTVRISGPEAEVNKINKVVARASVEDVLRQNETVDASLVALTKDDSTPKYISFNRQSEVLRITIPVYKITTLPVECSFINKPSDYIENLPFTVSISPAQAEFGIPEKRLEDLTVFDIISIDFSKLKEGVNTFTIDASDITSAVVLDGTTEFTVTVNVEGMTSAIIAAPKNVSFINIPGNAKAELITLDFDEITVVGPEASISQLDSENITVSADLNGIDEGVTGSVTVPVTVTDNDCWSYGEYTATVLIS